MTVERGLRLMAGTFVMLSAALAYFHSPYWLIFTGFVGLNLFQSAFTNWCPAMTILSKLGLKSCEAKAVELTGRRSPRKAAKHVRSHGPAPNTRQS
jgi:hypothetical protein